MAVSRLLVVCAVFVGVSVHLSGQQGRPAPAAPGAQESSTSRVAGNVERGRYLVERVAMCFECHSTRDPQGNIVPSTRYMGGSMPMRPAWNSDWPLHIPRIAGLPGYTDEQAIRLLTQGAIRRDGAQLRYPMPRFRMTQQDAADVIAFLRSL